MRKRNICCMTGTRADYPRVKSVLREIASRPDLSLSLIVTGMHLVPEFGLTKNEILKDGFHITEEVEMYDNDDSPFGMTKAAARCSMGITEALNRIKPDIFLITVDRVETMAAAMAGALLNLPMAHIQGGEVTGTIDESIRHAVTKLSHLHFAASADAAERIIKMGEEPRHVYQVGCPYLDIINNLRFKSRNELAQQYTFDPNKQLVLFTQHPVTTEYGQGVEHALMTIQALKSLSADKFEIVSLHSNADAGGRSIIEAMKMAGNFHIFPNITDTDYLSLMNEAVLMIGNSSAGIREAPSFKLPVVNIGTRQNGRQKAANVIDVANDVESIIGAISKALSSDFKNSLRNLVNPYGDGKSAKRIVDILSKIELGSQLIQKRIVY